MRNASAPNFALDCDGHAKLCMLCMRCMRHRQPS